MLSIDGLILVSDGKVKKGDIVQPPTPKLERAKGLIGDTVKGGLCNGYKIYRKPQKAKNR
jgi:hypothetical protein